MNRTMPRKNTPAPFKSSCFTETSRIAAGTRLLTKFAGRHPGAPREAVEREDHRRTEEGERRDPAESTHLHCRDRTSTMEPCIHR